MREEMRDELQDAMREIKEREVAIQKKQEEMELMMRQRRQKMENDWKQKQLEMELMIQRHLRASGFVAPITDPNHTINNHA